MLPTSKKGRKCEFKPLKYSTLAQVQTLGAMAVCILVMIFGWMHCRAWAERMTLQCDTEECKLLITRGSDEIANLTILRERLVSASKVRSKDGKEVDIDALTGKARRNIRGLDYTTAITYRDQEEQTGEPSRACVSWRQTGNCDGYGEREAEKDQACNAQIPNGLSGYCECEGDYKTAFVTCEHEPLICNEECSGVRWNRKTDLVWLFDLGRSRQRTITNEINWFIERREETKLDIVQTSRITWLGILLIVLGLLVSFLLCCFGEVIPEQKDHKY